MDELGDDQVRDLVVDRLPEEDDALAEEPGIDVVGALASRGLLDHHWDHWHDRSLAMCSAERSI